MSGINIFVKDEDDKKRLINEYLSMDDSYLALLDKLREELAAKGVDLGSPDGKKMLIREVRSLNADILDNPGCDDNR